jgi:hypothetical protein
VVLEGRERDSKERAESRDSLWGQRRAIMGLKKRKYELLNFWKETRN